MARYGVLKRHAAALADVLARRAEKRVDGDVKERGQALESFRVGERLTRFPYLKILVMYECLRLLA